MFFAGKWMELEITDSERQISYHLFQICRIEFVFFVFKKRHKVEGGPIWEEKGDKREEESETRDSGEMNVIKVHYIHV
jgi:hypothetical protein